MTARSAYLDHLNSTEMDAYRQYQQKYAKDLRESDKVLIQLLHEALPPSTSARSLLDVGCSTGNLLIHLGAVRPDLELAGADIDAAAIAENQRNAALARMHFFQFDMLADAAPRSFDVIVANASLAYFDHQTFSRAIQNLGSALRPGGYLIAFDYFHPYDQELAVTETSSIYPRGVTYHFRSYRGTNAVLESHGFATAEFRQFFMPFDLERPDDPTYLNSHTVQTSEGQRLSFRGILIQPWSHLVARKG
jgi:SAM-dependent methyltransferase